MNKKDLLLISIALFCTVIAWLIADIYNAATTEKLKTKVELPTIKKYDIDGDVLKALKEKKQ